MIIKHSVNLSKAIFALCDITKGSFPSQKQKIDSSPVRGVHSQIIVGSRSVDFAEGPLNFNCKAFK